MPKNRQIRAPRAPPSNNASHDLFAALVGARWALRRAKKSERRMIESLERMHATGEALWSSQPGARPRAIERQRTGDPLLKHVVLYGAFVVLRPLLTVAVAGGVLWAMWKRLLLLDLDMPGVGSAVAVAALGNLSPATRIVVLSGPIDDEQEIALFRVGVCGCCRRDIDAQLLKRVVHAVGLGEIWIRRSLTKRLIDDMARDEPLGIRRMRTRLESLTHREQQIAALVGSGGSNKQVALALAISERTVKAHLTEIFRKLGTGDRLKLALLVSRSA